MKNISEQNKEFIMTIALSLSYCIYMAHYHHVRFHMIPPSHYIP